MPHPLAYVLAEAAWATGFGEAPGGFIDYVRYLCVADGAKASASLGFKRGTGAGRPSWTTWPTGTRIVVRGPRSHGGGHFDEAAKAGPSAGRGPKRSATRALAAPVL